MPAPGTGFYRPFQSLVPGAIDALVALLTANFAGVEPAVTVKDGPFISMESTNQVIVIGWQGFAKGYEYPSRSMSEELLGADVEATNELQGMGPSQLERFSINCAAISRTGNEPTNAQNSANRATAYGLVAQVGAYLAPPGPYPGGLMRVVIAADHKLYQVADSRGILAIVTYVLNCEGFSQQ